MLSSRVIPLSGERGDLIFEYREIASSSDGYRSPRNDKGSFRVSYLC